ncbi:MAG: DUF5618 family protein [Planctomycetota bacterium]|nr:DUF5618 family protein [Planctomycetota bacterium]
MTDTGLHNAREILKKAPREGRTYTDIKFVQESCGTAYLSVIKSVDEYLLSRGLTKKELPRSYEDYQRTLRKHLSIHNGKLFREFNKLYDELHIAGYYRGLHCDVIIIKDIFNIAQQFIEKVGK